MVSTAPSARHEQAFAWDDSALSPLALEAMPALDQARPAVRGEIHLWHSFYDRINERALLERYARLLSDDERERHPRFLFAKDRHRYLVTRALVRTVLGRYGGIAPEAIRFGLGSHGRPFTFNPELAGVTFNLSHASGSVVCAVGPASLRLGVDVEGSERAKDVASLTESFLSPGEARAIDALPESQRSERLLWHWTLKEAYVKARGMGLSLPLEQCSFDFRAREDDVNRAPAIRVDLDPRLDDDAARWRFGLLRASPEHVLAYGIGTHGAAMPRLVVRASHVVPFVADG